MGTEKIKRIFFDGFTGALIDKDNVHINYKYSYESYFLNSCSKD